MKHRFTLPLFVVALLAASQPLLAAAPKANVRTAALVAALQAVSPDPLGGRLGLEVSTTRVAPLAAVPATHNYATAQSPRAEYDQRTYLIWKSAQKS